MKPLKHKIRNAVLKGINEAFDIDDMGIDLTTSAATKRHVGKHSRLYGQLKCFLESIDNDTFKIMSYKDISKNGIELLDHICLNYDAIDDDVRALADEHHVFGRYMYALVSTYKGMLKRHNGMHIDITILHKYKTYMTNENTGKYFDEVVELKTRDDVYFAFALMTAVSSKDFYWVKSIARTGHGFRIWIIDNDGNEIPVQDWDVVWNNNARFIRLTNNALTGNDIVLSVKSADYVTRLGLCSAQFGTDLIPGTRTFTKSEALSDYDGWFNTSTAMDNIDVLLDKYADESKKSLLLPRTKGDMISAMEAAYNVTEKVNGKEFHGYLPAMGQLLQMTMYHNVIDGILDMLGAGIVEINRQFWWSSTQDIEFNGEYGYGYTMYEG